MRCASPRTRRIAAPALIVLSAIAILAPAAASASPAGRGSPAALMVHAAGEYGPGMMGEGRGDYGPGMMDDEWSGAGDESGDGPSVAAMLGMMAVLIGAVGVGVLWLSRRRGDRSPALATLERRYANGELSTEQYEESRRLLEGS